MALESKKQTCPTKGCQAQRKSTRVTEARSVEEKYQDLSPILPRRKRKGYPKPIPEKIFQGGRAGNRQRFTNGNGLLTNKKHASWVSKPETVLCGHRDRSEPAGLANEKRGCCAGAK